MCQQAGITAVVPYNRPTLYVHIDTVGVWDTRGSSWLPLYDVYILSAPSKERAKNDGILQSYSLERHLKL